MQVETGDTKSHQGISLQLEKYKSSRDFQSKFCSCRGPQSGDLKGSHTHAVPCVGAPWRDMFPSLGRSRSPMGFGSLQSTFLWSIALLDGSSTPHFNPCNAKIRSKSLKISDHPRQFVYRVELLSDTGARKSTPTHNPTTKNKTDTEAVSTAGRAWEVCYESTQRYIDLLQQCYLGGVWEI